MKKTFALTMLYILISLPLLLSKDNRGQKKGPEVIKFQNQTNTSCVEHNKNDGKPKNNSHILSIKGSNFFLDGKPFDMWGIRTASASLSDEFTNKLIASLDDYKTHGVNMVSVYYMGSSGAKYDPFNAKGTRIDKQHKKRMERIVEECNKREMVVVLGIFYQNVDSADIHLKDWDACINAVKTVAKHVSKKNYRNVIINIANEQNSRFYENKPWQRVNNPEDIIELCKVVHEVDPKILVGGGGYDHDKNKKIGPSNEVDVLLFDTNGPEDSADLFRQFVEAGTKNKPIVNVELFGGYTKKFMPPGVFPDKEGKDHYYREIDSAKKTEGLYVSFHTNTWTQTPSLGDEYEIRYDLGGDGTEKNPGMRWYFEYVKKVRGL